MKIIVYATQTSPRLEYILDFFSSVLCSEKILLTTDLQQFQNSDAIKINYAENFETADLWIQPTTLLFEKEIKQQQIIIDEWNGLKIFFTTSGDIPFDIFAASFFLLSRYEEYLPHAKDMYGRYAHENCIAYKNNFLHLPLINMWMVELKKILESKRPQRTIRDAQFNFIPTYDIDIAYAYLHKPFLNNLGNFYKELFTGKWKQMAERANVFSGWKKDPFDTYDWLDELHAAYQLQPIYFLLLAEKRKGYDKNIPPGKKGIQQLFRSVAEKYTTGIHPSWQSGDDIDFLKNEFASFEKITKHKAVRSRQHYIRMNLPDTYRTLLSLAVQEEFSMGYGSINGFRASVASAFYWYDLEKEIQTNLLVHPYCYMEANSFFEQNYTAEQAANELQQYHDIVKTVNGSLITIFHNHFVTEQKEWLPWRNMYADFLKRNFG